MSDIAIYKVGGAGCAACILKIQNIVKPLTGIETARFDLKNSTLTVTGLHKQDDVITAMGAGGFTAELEATQAVRADL